MTALPQEPASDEAPDEFQDEAGALLAAYHATTYIADDGEQKVGVRLGEKSAGMDALLMRLGAASGVFITAYNPQSRPTGAAENRNAAESLAAEIAGLELRTLPHRSVGDEGDWIEEGLFVLDLPLGTAVPLAECYGQNAVVVISRGGEAYLLPTRWLAAED